MMQYLCLIGQQAPLTLNLKENLWAFVKRKMTDKRLNNGDDPKAEQSKLGFQHTEEQNNRRIAWKITFFEMYLCYVITSADFCMV